MNGLLNIKPDNLIRLMLAIVLVNLTYTLYFNWQDIGAVVITLLLSTILYWRHRQNQQLNRDLQLISTYCQSIAEGNIQCRTTQFDKGHPLANIAEDINYAVDQVEILIHETNTLIAYAQEDKFYRPALLNGSKGVFKLSLEKIAESLQHMKTSSELQTKTEFNVRISKSKSDKLLTKLQSSQNDIEQIVSSMIKTHEDTKTIASEAIDGSNSR